MYRPGVYGRRFLEKSLNVYLSSKQKIEQIFLKNISKMCTINHCIEKADTRNPQVHVYVVV